jgi:O-methyltransferase
MKRISTLAAVTRLAFRPRTSKAHLSVLLQQVRAEATYSALYAKYAEYTMIPKGTYINNLSLIDEHRAVAGCVVECGVWRGGMIAGIAELLGPDRQYVLFDSFEGLPPAKVIDGPAAREWQADTTDPAYCDNCSAPSSFASHAMQLAGARNVSVHAGWFKDTLQQYVPPAPIAILRLDGDWYDSTMVCLEALFAHLAPEGVVIVDDYSTWDGCRRAVNDYLYRYKPLARILQWRDDVTYIKLPTLDPSSVPTAGSE